MGVVGRSLSGVARGQRALLEADDAVGNVRGVRVDRRHADRREVVREVAPRVELAVLGAVAAALLVGGAPGEVTEEAGPAGGYISHPWSVWGSRLRGFQCKNLAVGQHHTARDPQKPRERRLFSDIRNPEHTDRACAGPRADGKGK